MSNFQDVGRFHEKFGLHEVREDVPEGIGPQDPEWDEDLLEFRTKFLDEELTEFKEGVAARDHAKAFDALIDLVYVALGTAHLQGYPWQAGWDRVQAANMAKVRAAKDGSDSVRGSAWDVVKPPGWTAPDIEGLLAARGFGSTVQREDDLVPKCSMCRRQRTAGDGDHPMDSYDYSPLQVVTGKPVGWYSGDDGQVCPECMTKTLASQR